jgi:hypothetical protein
LEGGIGNSRRLIRFRLVPSKSLHCDKSYHARSAKSA